MDPITISLASVGSVALTEGIKFLYSQTGELLKEWREHRTSGKPGDIKPALPRLPAVFDGELKDPVLHSTAMSELEPQLRALYGELGEYGNGISPVESTDILLLKKVNALRECLEGVLGQRITFRGERREATGTSITGFVTANTVRGLALGVELERAPEGSVSGGVEANAVLDGGTAIGVRLKRYKSDLGARI
jgi:hypothetical protein